MLKKNNLILLISPLIIFSFGFVALLSTSGPLVRSHVVYFIVGYLFFLLFSSLDHAYLKHLWKYIYLVSVILLLITFAFAELRLGAARWIEIGGLTFQTSEFAKFALILAVSSMIENNLSGIKDLRFLGILVLLMALPVFLIFVQPDLGTTLVLLSTFLGMLFFSGINKMYFLYVFLAAGIFSAPIWHILKDYQKNRILVFLNPQLDVLGSGYNVIQSLIAVGSGGFWGKGFGRGTQANLKFLPAHWTDFIFASFAEEWGFFGVILLIFSFCLLLVTILYVAYKSEELFGKIFCVGVFMVIFIQFMVNVGMNLGVMPVTGVTLPLVSYGGSSMIITMLLLGVVHNIWRTNNGKFM